MTDPLQSIIEEWLGPDEDASWQKIWQNGKSHKIDDPVIEGQNELRAELRKRIPALIAAIREVEKENR